MTKEQEKKKKITNKKEGHFIKTSSKGQTHFEFKRTLKITLRDQGFHILL